METTKICSKCKTEKLTTEFNKCLSKKDGLYPSCKECRKKFEIDNKEKILINKKIYREKNKDIINKKQKERYKQNPEYYHSRNKIWDYQNREKVIAYKKEYYKANKERLNIKNKKWYEDNKTNALTKQKEYYEKNKNSIKEKSKLYRLRNIEKIRKYEKIRSLTIEHKISKRTSNHKRNIKIRTTNDKTINKNSLIELREKQNNKCYYCNCELDFQSKGKVHLDHYIPISRGGIHSISNVVWSCSSCNLSKHKTVPTTLILI